MARKRQKAETTAQRIINEIWALLRKSRRVSGQPPTESVLSDWINSDCPLDVRTEADGRLAATLGSKTELHWREIDRLMELPADHPEHRFRDAGGNPVTPPHVAIARPGATLIEAEARYSGLHEDELRTAHIQAREIAPEWWGLPISQGGPRAVWTMTRIGLRALEDVHGIWSALPPDRRSKHPLAPILEAWNARAGPLFQVRQAASLAEWHRTDPSDLRLMSPGDAPPMANLSEETQLLLPEFFHRAPVADDGTISWILALYALSGGPINGQTNLPAALVMAIGAMAHLHVRARDSQWHTLEFPSRITHREDWPLDIPPPWPEDTPPASMEEWLYPAGGMTNPWRDWQNIRTGLQDIGKRLTYIPIPGFGDVAWIVPAVIPRSRDDPLVKILIQIPKSAANGTVFDFPYFLSLARGGHARLAKAYLSAVAYMGRSAQRGMFLTAERPRAVLGRDGKPIRGCDGKPRRDPTLGFEPNPDTRFLRPLTGRALARMEGFENPSKERIRDARRDFERLAADGVLDLIREGRDRFRIAGPSAKVRASSVSNPGVISEDQT